MKKMRVLLNLFLVVGIVAATVSCKKDDDDSSGGGGGIVIPAEFTQKSLVEEYSGAWCGFCPDGAYMLKQMIDNNSGRVIGITIHAGDAMELPAYSSFYDPTFNVSGFPTGMVDRIGTPDVAMSRSLWESSANQNLQRTAPLGLRIAATQIVGDTLTIDVMVGFNQDISAARNLSVMLVEDGVTGTGSGYDQRNYYSSQGAGAGGSSHPYYSEPDPIVGYEHDHTLRAIVSANAGDAIDAGSMVSGGSFQRTYKVNISAYNTNNLHVVAFVTDASNHQVINAQEAGVGSVKNFD